MSLEEIKEQYAKQEGCYDFNHYLNIQGFSDGLIDLIAELCAQQRVNEVLDKAARLQDEIRTDNFDHEDLDEQVFNAILKLKNNEK